MTDAALLDLLRQFVLPAAAILAAVMLVRRSALRLLHRHAPAWLVGPGGFLIDTTGRLGLWQMRPDHHELPPGRDGGCD